MPRTSEYNCCARSYLPLIGVCRREPNQGLARSSLSACRRRRRGLLVELDGAIEFAEQLVHIAQVQQRPDSPDASMASLLAASASRLSSSARTHFAAGGVISAEMRQRPALTAAVLELTLNRQRACSS